jgi:hypothetical protein
VKFTFGYRPDAVRKPTIETAVHDYAWNRYNEPLAFAVQLRIENVYFTPIEFLPPIDLAAAETLLIVLRDVCGVPLDAPEPPWLERYAAPGQREVDGRIRELEAQRDSIDRTIEEARAERVRVRSPLKLLYERETPLEPVVRDVLRTLGAEVEEPPEGESKEDGWITVMIDGVPHHGVIEVKSTRADSFDERGIRQAVEWRTRGVELRLREYKPIFIGNSAVDKPFGERPYPFSDSWRKNAQLQRVAALRAEELLGIYVLERQGELDRDAFWRDVFATNGVVDLRSHLARLPSGDEAASPVDQGLAAPSP